MSLLTSFLLLMGEELDTVFVSVKGSSTSLRLIRVDYTSGPCGLVLLAASVYVFFLTSFVL